MPWSPSGIPFKWRVTAGQSPQERFTQAGNQTTIRLACLWRDAAQLKAELMASAEHVPGQAWFNRTIPYRNPNVNSELQATGQYLVSLDQTGAHSKVFEDADDPEYDEDFDVNGDPIDGGGNLATHIANPDPEYDEWPEWLKIEYACTFGNLPYPVGIDTDVNFQIYPEIYRYCTAVPEQVPYNRVIPGYAVVTDEPNPKPIMLNAAVPEVHTRWQVRMWWWPWPFSIPWTAIDACTNKVNSAEVFLPQVNKTFAIGTLLYTGVRLCSPDPYTGPDGNVYMDFFHTFVENIIGWNKQRDFQTGNTVDLKISGSSPVKRPFLTADLNTVFLPA